MKKIILFAIVFLAGIKLSAQDKYLIEYEFFEKDGNNKKNFTLSRDGSKLKLKGISKEGATVTMYILKDEGNIYTLTETKDVKIGTKFRGLDCNYVGMQWGVYILDLDKCEFLLQSGTSQGTANVAGKDCTIYNVMQSGDLRTDYFIYNNILMLKRTTPATTIQAINFNENPVFSPDEFIIPSNIQWLDQN